MDKQRIQVYADSETKRRIELAAAKRNISVTEYCLDAVRQQLADDDLLEAAQVEIAVTPQQKDDTLIADLRALREAILADREGKLLDVDDFIEQTRKERDRELT
jgi:uncharacterized protein (DUF1778 family)